MGRLFGWTLGSTFPLVTLSLAAILSPAAAQDLEWNTPRVLRLIEEGRAVRSVATQDTAFRSYSSEARGYVYFFLDRSDTKERILVKADQIALDVFWKAPNLTKQRIVGMRDQKSLPTNIQYHLDHLLVVQDDFGDRIRIGGGDEVASVVHPLAPGSERFYDFLLADSVTLTLPGASGSVRVYEVQVRPKDFDRPGFVGSVFLDRDTGAIVRMSFTFTPASYIDSFLDYIRISVENGLWMGSHWLPYKQQLEIRREVPYLDFPAGSVIRGWFDIGNYEINPDLPTSFFLGSSVTVLPDSVRKAFPFEEGLYAQLDREGREGLSTPPDMTEIRSLALSIAKDRYLSGLGHLRLFLPQPTASSVLRYDRAEGLFLGGGASYGLRPWLNVALHGGVAIGRERPSLLGRVTGGERHPGSGMELYWNRPLFMGPVQPISGALNTMAGLALEEDYTDLWFGSGARIFHTWGTSPGRTLGMEARLERHRAARNIVSEGPSRSGFRQVLPAEDGTWSSVALDGSMPIGPSGLQVDGRILGGRFGARSFGKLSAGLTIDNRWRAKGTRLSASLQGGVTLGDPPRQALALLGGRGTVPGYPFRERVGDRYWLFRTEGSVDVLRPYLRLRAFAAAGGTGYDGPSLPPPWPQDRSSATLLSAGMGLGIGWDVMRLDLARGLSDGGKWELMLSVNPEFWAWL